MVIVLAGMIAAGIGYSLRPAVAMCVSFPVVVIALLALLIKTVYQCAHRGP